MSLLVDLGLDPAPVLVLVFVIVFDQPTLTHTHLHGYICTHATGSTDIYIYKCVKRGWGGISTEKKRSPRPLSAPPLAPRIVGSSSERPGLQDPCRTTRTTRCTCVSARGPGH